MNKTLKQLLIEKGVSKNEIDTHESDLYCKVSYKADAAIKEYEQIIGCSVCKEIFIDKTTKEHWYDIPFGFMPEHYTKKMSK